MTPIDFITELFLQVDDKLTQENKNQKHARAKLYPSEVVTLALLFALKGVGTRAFYRWIDSNYSDYYRINKLIFIKPHRCRFIEASPDISGSSPIIGTGGTGLDKSGFGVSH